jgi:hypothetical protein
LVKIEINPARIERVTIEARSQMEYDFDLATHALIQPMLRRINQELKRQIARTQSSTFPPRDRQSQHGMRLAG